MGAVAFDPSLLNAGVSLISSGLRSCWHLTSLDSRARRLRLVPLAHVFDCDDLGFALPQRIQPIDSLPAPLAISLPPSPAESV